MPVPADLGAARVLHDPGDAVGRRVAAPVSAGEPVTQAALGGAPAPGRRPLAVGERAVAVPLSAAAGAAAAGSGRAPASTSSRRRARGSPAVRPSWCPTPRCWASPRRSPTTGAAPGDVSSGWPARQALRITAALNFAREVRLLVRPPDEVGAAPGPRSGGGPVSGPPGSPSCRRLRRGRGQHPRLGSRPRRRDAAGLRGSSTSTMTAGTSRPRGIWWATAPPKTCCPWPTSSGGVHLRHAGREHRSGATVLAAPARPGAGAGWRPRAIAALVAAARDAAGPVGAVVIDAGAGVPPDGSAGDALLLVCPPTLCGARRAAAALAVLCERRDDRCCGSSSARAPGRPRSGARALGRLVGAPVAGAPAVVSREAGALGGGRWPEGAAPGSPGPLAELAG